MGERPVLIESDPFYLRQALLVKELLDSFGYVGHLIWGQFRIDGKREGFLGCLFCDRKCPFVIPQRLVTFLKMEGYRVINAIANVLFSQEGTQVISLRGPDGELVIDMGIPRRYKWKGDAII